MCVYVGVGGGGAFGRRLALTGTVRKASGGVFYIQPMKMTEGSR